MLILFCGGCGGCGGNSPKTRTRLLFVALTVLSAVGEVRTSLRLDRMLRHRLPASGGQQQEQEQQQPPPHGDKIGSYVDQLERSLIEKSCPNCLYHLAPSLADGSDGEPAHALRLEAIKRQILSKLGLRHKPNVTCTFSRELIMKTLVRATEEMRTVTDREPPAASHLDSDDRRPADDQYYDGDDFYGRTSEIIAFADPGYRVNGNRLLEFRISLDHRGESGEGDAGGGGGGGGFEGNNEGVPVGQGREFKVRTATLWLKADARHRHHKSKTCKTTEIYVFKFISSITKSIRINSKEFNELTDDPIAFQLTTPGWQKVDLTRTVSRWLELSAGAKLRLLVDCSCCSDWNVRLFNGNESGGSAFGENRPFLVVHTDPTTTKRVRRRALDCDSDATGNQCCKQRFYVSFKELGWDDWIIAPQGYYANYCRGDCGHHRTPDTFVTYHTHVIEEIRKTHHLSGMHPCCAPLKFSSMSLIYFGPDANIIKRDLPKMVVDECGCP